MNDEDQKDLTEKLSDIEFDLSDSKKFFSIATALIEEIIEFLQASKDRAKKLSDLLNGMLGIDAPTNSILKKTNQILKKALGLGRKTRAVSVIKDVLSITEAKLNITKNIDDQITENRTLLQKLQAVIDAHALHLIESLRSDLSDEEYTAALNEVTDLITRASASYMRGCIPTYLALIVSDNADVAFLDIKKPIKNQVVSGGITFVIDGVGVYVPFIGTAKKIWEKCVEDVSTFGQALGEAGTKYDRVRLYKAQLKVILGTLSELGEERLEALYDMGTALTEVENLQSKISEMGRGANPL